MNNGINICLRYVSITLMMLCALIIRAENPRDNGIVVEANFGLNYTHWSLTPDPVGDITFYKHIGMIIDGRLGYQFNDHIISGVMMKHENIKHLYGDGTRKYLGFGVYGIYRFNKVRRFPLRFFIEAHALFAKNKIHWQFSYPRDDGMTEIGLVPGVSYSIPKTPLEVKLRYLFIGYNNENKYLKSMGGCLGRGDWIIDAGLRRLELGLAFTFKFPHNKSSK